MHILHVLDHSIPLQSGYTFRTRAILEQQRALGWETRHVTSPKHYIAESLEEEIEGFHFYRSPRINSVSAKIPVVNQLLVMSNLARRVEQIIQEAKPDILHAHSPALNGLAVLKLSKHYQIPVVYECRAFWEDAAVDHGTCREGGIRYRLTRQLETYVFKQAEAVVTICEGLRGDMIARGIDSKKITVVPNAVDIQRFNLACEPEPDLISRLGLQDKVVLGFIGSFYAYEGLPLLLEALGEILVDFPNVRVLLVGGGPQDTLLRERARALGVEAQVVFTGRVAHSEVQRYYNLVDIFVYPRYSMRLTELVTPLKPLEAMAQGRLVVASDIGGHREIIRDGETGRLFQAGNAKELARTIKDLLQHREQWPDFRTAGRQFVERERSWIDSVSRYAAVYQKLANRNK